MRFLHKSHVRGQRSVLIPVLCILFSVCACANAQYIGQAPGKLINGGSGGGGNATVPNDAPIQPPQAFVDCFTSYATVDLLDFPSKGITGLTANFDTLLANIWNGVSNSTAINFSGNALDVASVNRVLALVVAHLGDGDPKSIDLSGGTNAAPTLPKFVIDFNNLDVSTLPANQYRYYGSAKVGALEMIVFSGDGALNSSTTQTNFGDASSGNFFIIGVSNSPTKQQIIDKLVALGGGKIVDLGGLIIRVSPVNYDLEPLDFTGMTGSSLIQGNNDIGVLRASGWTVTTN